MKHITLLILFIGITSLNFSCKKLVSIDAPKDKLAQQTLFENDDLAITAINGIYGRMNTFTGVGSISHVCGISADEFKNYSSTFTEFFANQISPINGPNTTLYANYYVYIYSANAILEGLSNSSGLTPKAKSQLQGEALFIRAFCYFYLVNLYGPVPLQLTTDYRITRIAPRTAEAGVYQQIISDLKTAEMLLTDVYVTTERVRPNLGAVQALEARTYLYMNDWANAEKYANLVISKTIQYNLLPLNDVFLKNSKEAIWQLMPTPINGNTLEGNFSILTATPTFQSLTTDLVLNGFEANDKRKTSWIGTFTNTSETYYYPYKYKLKTATPISEYSMILRLAEQYLIRAEARAQQNNLSMSIDDLDVIRDRAGLLLIKDTNPTISQIDLLSAIQRERRVELFSEWGHRWLDLKRAGQSTIVLAPIKTQWQSTDVLFPIPYNETSRNPNVK